jgi:hypothetical protein
MAQVTMVAWGGMAAVCLPMVIVAAAGYGLEGFFDEKITTRWRGREMHRTGLVAAIYGAAIAGVALVVSVFYLVLVGAGILWLIGWLPAATRILALPLRRKTPGEPAPDGPVPDPAQTSAHASHPPGSPSDHGSRGAPKGPMDP